MPPRRRRCATRRSRRSSDVRCAGRRPRDAARDRARRDAGAAVARRARTRRSAPGVANSAAVPCRLTVSAGNGYDRRRGRDRSRMIEDAHAKVLPSGRPAGDRPHRARGRGAAGVVARLISDRLAAALGQPVVVENRPGASGAIGTQSVVAAVPDGHTLLVGQTAEVAINQHWIKGLSYDPEKDLQPVALATVVPLALVIPAAAPYSTLPDMLKAAARKELTFASSGTGTPGHFAGELLKL